MEKTVDSVSSETELSMLNLEMAGSLPLSRMSGTMCDILLLARADEEASHCDNIASHRSNARYIRGEIGSPSCLPEFAPSDTTLLFHPLRLRARCTERATSKNALSPSINNMGPQPCIAVKLQNQQRDVRSCIAGSLVIYGAEELIPDAELAPTLPGLRLTNKASSARMRTLTDYFDNQLLLVCIQPRSHKEDIQGQSRQQAQQPVVR